MWVWIGSRYLCAVRATGGAAWSVVMRGPYDSASPARAAAAGAGDLEGVPVDDVAVLTRNGRDPPLERRRRHLDRRAAGAADEVMVVLLGAAAPVGRLTAGAAHDVDQTGFAQPLECPIDAGQPDRLPLGPQPRVQVLCRDEGRDVGECRQHGTLRLGRGTRGHGSTDVTPYINPTPQTVRPSVASDGCLACASGRMSLAPM